MKKFEVVREPIFIFAYEVVEAGKVNDVTFCQAIRIDTGDLISVDVNNGTALKSGDLVRYDVATEYYSPFDPKNVAAGTRLVEVAL